MTSLTCALARQWVWASRDGELSLEDQILVEAHLKSCEACRAEVGVAEDVRETLRALGGLEDLPGSLDGCGAVGLAAIEAAVLPRVKAERTVTLARQVGDLFDDLRLVWAVSASAAAALLVCGVLLFGLLHVAKGRPDSLAALMEAVYGPPAAAVPARQALVLPRAFPDAVMPAMMINQQRGENAVLALAVVVMPDGSLTGIEPLPLDGQSDATFEKEGVMYLLDAASTARFEPARQAGTPVSLNVVWVLTDTTVRGTPFRSKATPAASVLRPTVRTTAPEVRVLARALTTDRGLAA